MYGDTLSIYDFKDLHKSCVYKDKYFVFLHKFFCYNKPVNKDDFYRKLKERKGFECKVELITISKKEFKNFYCFSSPPRRIPSVENKKL